MNEPAGESRCELVFRRSRFLGYARKAESVDEVRAYVRAERERHSGCSHVVYAYLLGPQGALFGMTDDREPKGTAGRPILEVLKGSGTTNLLVAVTRFFGGTKLGTGGLVKAYSETAVEALSRLSVVAFVERTPFKLSIPYELFDRASRAVTDLGGCVDAKEFGMEVDVAGRIPAESWELLTASMLDLTAGRRRPVRP